MLNRITYKITKILLTVMLCLMTTACIGTVIGAVVDTTIEVIKVPFKVGAAVIDVATDDDFTDDANNINPAYDEISSDAAAIKMENAELQ